MNRSEALDEWYSQSSYGQVRLNSYEMSQLPLGNQFTDDLSIMEWQCVKAVAVEHDIGGWTSLVDTSLTYGENMALLESHAAPSMKKLGMWEVLRGSPPPWVTR